MAPVIAPLIGLGGLGLVGEAIVGIGLSFGVSYLARKLQPQPSNQAAQGMQLSLSYNANGPRQIAFGLAASAGSLVYHNTYGPNGNDYVQLVFRLADTPCTSLETVFVDGKEVTFGAEVTTGNQTGYTVDQYSGRMWIKFHDGAWDQAADADLVAKATGADGWSSNNRGRGVCYVRVTLKYDAEKFKNGIPPFLFVFKGAKVYDWRKDSTAGGSGSHRWGEESTYEWTDNPAVCLYNYKRGIYVNGKKVGGMNVPGVSMPTDVWTAAANACNESVNLKAGGSEKRYRLNGIIDVDTEHATVVRDMVSTMAGTLADASGVFKLYAGVARAPVLTITDDDLVSNAPVKFVPKLSRSGLVNAVFGSFNDPDKLYQSSSLPPRISPNDEAADGGVELTENYSLAYVSSQSQGQRILEILRRKGRYQRSLSLTLCAKAAMLESGDWITFNSERYGFSGVTFEVTLGTLNRDATVPVELREVSDSIYPWSAGSDELDPLNPADVGSGGARLATVQGVALYPFLLLNEETGEQMPGLDMRWTPIDDATVVNLEVKYRKIGDAGYLTKTILKPGDGECQWIEGIQGEVKYEVQVDLVTLPERATVATAWIPMDDSTEPTVVAVAALAHDIPDGTVTPPKLSEQVLSELRLITDKAAIQASVARQIEDAYAWAKQAAETALSGRLEAFEQGARVTQAITQQVEGDKAIASLVNTAVTWIEENAATVTEVIESLDGVSARWGAQVSIAANGKPYVTGLVRLDGSADGSTFLIGADNFTLFDPNVNGGDPVQVVTIAENPDSPGTYRMVFNGEMIAAAIRAGLVEVENLKALSSKFGDMTCSGIQRSANGKKVINWDTGQEWIDS